ncbi:shikimate dehydrogenase family protein [Winogradskyella litorisediminis]|uniref:Shikimate dehydrogenase family protein n=1 Tax=Winogradskyella litorisediminis TaxID=1156618 RepID=A0ABW3N7J9_9FLAO
MENARSASKFKFGLVGKEIDYSFSRGYFAKKFEAENLPHSYVNFDLENISKFPSIFETSKNIKGLNVTIPYKEDVIPFLDKLNKTAKAIGAVNTIRVTKKRKRVGYNTDYYGFKKSLEPHLKKHHKKALIFGTGGASKAIAYALKLLKIEFKFVSRSKKNLDVLTYSELTESIIQKHQILINCSPVGTFPNVEQCLDIPYNGITEHHILYDLIYNPAETKFLQHGKNQNATIINGSKMLELQAEKSWRIWNK